MLATVGPEQIDREVASSGFPKTMWPFRDGARWAQYRKLYEELTEEGRMNSAVFGKKFAEAYMKIGGERYEGELPEGRWRVSLVDESKGVIVDVDPSTDPAPVELRTD